jgi:hypothetical protein
MARRRHLPLARSVAVQHPTLGQLADKLTEHLNIHLQIG